jgi:hypothetical protein
MIITVIQLALFQEPAPTTQPVPTSTTSAIGTSQPASLLPQLVRAGSEWIGLGLFLARKAHERAYWDSFQTWPRTEWAPASQPTSAFPAFGFATPRFSRFDRLEIRRAAADGPALLLSVLEEVPDAATVGPHRREYQAVYCFDPTTNLVTETPLTTWNSTRTGSVWCNQQAKKLGKLEIRDAVKDQPGQPRSTLGARLFVGDRMVDTRGLAVVLIQALPGGKRAAVVSVGGYQAPSGGWFFGRAERFGDPYYLQVFDTEAGEPVLPAQEIPLPRGANEIQSSVLPDDSYLVLVSKLPSAVCFVKLPK